MRARAPGACSASHRFLSVICLPSSLPARARRHHAFIRIGSVINPLEPPARALLYVSLMLLAGLPIGLAVVVLPVFRQCGISAHGALALSRRWLVLASAGLVIGAVAFFAAQVIPLEMDFSTAGEWAQFAQQSLLGQMLLARVALGLVALLVPLLAPRPGIWLIVCAVVGLLAQATVTRTSHSAAMGEGWLPVVSDYAHLAAGALWVGGLVALLIALQTPRSAGAQAMVTRSLIRRFSPLGIAGVALAAGTGLVLSAALVPNAEALRTTEYGNVLLLKIALAVAAVMLAGVHKFITQRRIKTTDDVRRFRRTLGIETAIVAAVFGCAALLTSAAPPHKSMTHQMADGSSMTLLTADPTFERSLLIAALAIVAVGAIALALEWRARPTTS
jgi:copper transport protein